MKQKLNHQFKNLFLSDKRYHILMGGRGAGRSTAASQFALSKLTSREYFRCAIMRFVLSDIRNSIYQDIVDRAEESGIKDELILKENNLNILYGQNKISGIGFRKSSGDQKSKLKSLANYNAIIIEEAEEVAEDDFMQLDDSIRTIKSDIKIILNLNPPSKHHWIIKNWFNLIPSGYDGFYIPELKKSRKNDTEFYYNNLKANTHNLNQKTIDNYAKYKNVNSEHYYNMILGLVSEGAKGRVYKNWKTITNEEFNKLPYPSFYGLDFGFSNSQAALVEMKEHNANVYAKELIYELELSPSMLARRFEELGIERNVEIYADYAEPAQMKELKDKNWNVIKSNKGDNIKTGINFLKDRQVYYTEESNNIAFEYQEYKWGLDKDKNPTDKPVDKNNHLMDAIRYAVYSHNKKPFVGIV